MDDSPGHVRLADADRQQGQGDRAARRHLHRQCREVRRARRQDPRGVRRRPHASSWNGRSRDGEIRDDRDRGHAKSRTGDSGHRARHFIERGVSSADAAKAYRDSRRRLYRTGVRLYFCGLRLQRDAGLSRRQYFARVRRRRAGPCAGRDGKGRHHHPDRLHGQPDRQGRQARHRIHHASVQWLEHRLRSGDVRDRTASERRQSRAWRKPASPSIRTMAASQSTASRAPRCRTSTRSGTSPIAPI